MTLSLLCPVALSTEPESISRAGKPTENQDPGGDGHRDRTCGFRLNRDFATDAGYIERDLATQYLIANRLGDRYGSVHQYADAAGRRTGEQKSQRILLK